MRNFTGIFRGCNSASTIYADKLILMPSLNKSYVNLFSVCGDSLVTTPTLAQGTWGCEALVDWCWGSSRGATVTTYATSITGGYSYFAMFNDGFSNYTIVNNGTLPNSAYML